MADDNMTLGYLMGQEGSSNSNGGFGGMFGEGLWAIIILAMLGFGGRGFGGFGGCGGDGGCATQADVRAAVDQQTLISKLDNQTYGLADSTYALNNTINSGFYGVDKSLCSIGHQISDCCCATQGAIRDVGFGIERATMQNRFDAQTYNCNTLQAIDKLGDRIIDYMANDKAQALRDENFALKLAASQAAQNNYLVGQLRPAPVPAFTVPAPYCYGYNAGGYNGGCSCGC